MVTTDLTSILRQIGAARSAIHAGLKQYPTQRQTILHMLDEAEVMVQRVWPLLPRDRKRIAIGVYAAKNIDDLDLDTGSLASQLCELDSALRCK